MDVIVVISHFKENLDWVSNLKYKSIVWEKAVNRGREALAYCQYFYDYYDKLPDWSVCVHGHRSAWHNPAPADILINNLKFARKYRGLSKTMIPMLHYEWDYTRNVWPVLFDGILSLPPNLIFRSGGQFLVHSQLVQSIDRSVYKKWCDWLCNNKMGDLAAARVFEFTWCYIFTKQWNENNWYKILIL